MNAATEIAFLSYLRKEKGLFHFNLYMQYRCGNVEEGLNQLAHTLQNENHLRNLEEWWRCFSNGTSYKQVIIPFKNERISFRSSSMCCKANQIDNDYSDSEYDDMPSLVCGGKNTESDDEYKDMPPLIPCSTVNDNETSDMQEFVG